MALICDTGPLLAALDSWCSKLGLRDAWLLFLDDVDAGAWRIAWPLDRELRRARELEGQYADLGLGVVDGSIIALAERLGEDRIASLDRRHFGAVRPPHAPAFRLLPD